MKTGVRWIVGGWPAWLWMCCILAQGGCDWRPSAPRVTSVRSHLDTQSGQSQMATWTCTGDPCPWGDELSNPALAWPAEWLPINTRLGYTVSPAVYLPANMANGLTVTIDFGSAGVHAGAPQDDSHELLASLSAGDSFDVFGLDDDEVLSVQSDDAFGYHVAPFDPSSHPDAGTDDGTDAGTPDAGTDDGTDAGTPDAGTDGGADAGTDAGTDDGGDAGTPDDPPPDAAPPVDIGPPPDVPASSSQETTWACSGRQCPFGDTLNVEQAVVWDLARGSIATRMGYTASATVYLFGSRANGTDLWIATGTVTLFAGLPGDLQHRTLATLGPGDAFEVSGLSTTEVLSVQSDAPFTYWVRVTPETMPPGVTPDPGGPMGELVQGVPALWRCNPEVPDCFSDDWTGAAVSWPSGSAFSSNARPGNLSRSVFAWDDTRLFPYIGPWAEGCEITGVSGITRVIEWQRGAESWRDTWLYPGQSHVIHLIPPEDGALLEGYDASPGFTASVRNCTPQPLQP